MIKSHHQVIIKRPAQEVWQFIMDPDNFPIWTPNIREIKASDGLNKGSEISFRLASLGRELYLSGKITRNTGRAFTLATSQGPIDFLAEYTLTSLSDSRTQVEITTSADVSGVYHLAESLIKSVNDANTRGRLETLKLVLEAAPHQVD